MILWPHGGIHLAQEVFAAASNTFGAIKAGSSPMTADAASSDNWAASAVASYLAASQDDLETLAAAQLAEATDAMDNLKSAVAGALPRMRMYLEKRFEQVRC